MSENKTPDYKQIYLTLLNEVENTIQKLISVQKACEEIYIDTSKNE